VLFLTTYTLKEHLRPSETKRLMEEYTKSGEVEGSVAHYVRVDGTGGVIVSENEDALSIFRSVLPYAEFMQFDVTPAVKIEDAVGPLLSFVADA
jgi:Domain of unknown function (DUF3303)